MDIYKWSCTDANMGEIKTGNITNTEYVCKYGGLWKIPNYKDRYCLINDCQYFTDSRDKQGYAYVAIGTQTWLAENLNYNADGSKCYSNQESNCAKYGRLYNWATALTACPPGWHLPSDAEWTALTDYVGGSSKAGTKLKAISGWNSYSGIPVGTDEFGFSALPGGYGLGHWWKFPGRKTSPTPSVSYHAELQFLRILLTFPWPSQDWRRNAFHGICPKVLFYKQ